MSKQINESKLRELIDSLKTNMSEMGGRGAPVAPKPVTGPNGEPLTMNNNGQLGYRQSGRGGSNFFIVDPAGKPIDTATSRPAPDAVISAYKARVLADSGKRVTPQATKTAPQATKTAPVAGAPTVGYEKDFPAATAMEIQKQLNAKGEKLVVDGKMGPATREAMKRHPEVTTQTDAEKAAASGQDTAPAPEAPETTTPRWKPTPTNATVDTTKGPNYSANNPHVPKPDTSRQDAWEKLTPSQQKWIGGADPTDTAILARMPKPLPDELAPQQQAQNVLQPGTNPTTTPGTTPAPLVAKESVTFGSDPALARIVELSRKY
jgi:peptidoglycan hydrolase-like protein with peptidoglycan-binding domain